MKSIIQHINLLYKTAALAFLCFSAGSCTEQYVFQTNIYESLPVVQANITNELKRQEIKITRTYRLEEYGPEVEQGANVYVTDSDKNNYEFELDEFLGVYLSKEPFQAVPGKTYQLNITTKDGKSYNSSLETLTPINEINVEPKIETIDGYKGVQIVVTSNDPTAKSKFYRFEYEETYKIVSPDWVPFKLIPDPTNPGPEFTFLTVPRPNPNSKICYTTNKSDNLILISNVGLSEDKINLPIRFINIDDPILYERYSIMVREYTQNLASYTYYSTLKSLSTSESLLSQVQPGFNYGNLKATDNSGDKIVGYFEVSSVSSKRIFFNFRDIFIDDPYPSFMEDCGQKIELLNCFTEKFCRGPQIYSIVTGSGMEYVYYGTPNQGFTYIFTPSVCGDCTKVSSNIKPPFWID